ncbi:MAG: hypothetical protein ACRELB_14910 [Polyangiaceae bacterium]
MGFISQAADRSSATFGRANLIDLGTQVLRLVNDVRDTQTRALDGVLGRIGLQRRQSILRPVLWIAAGAVAAGAVVLVVAPSSGKELRLRVAGWLAHERDVIADAVAGGSRSHQNGANVSDATTGA